MKIYARQGDLVIQKATLGKFDGAKKVTNYVLAGSGSSSHILRGTSLVLAAGPETSIRLAEDSSIDHQERHLSTPMPAGDYLVAPLRERHGDADRAVED